METKIVKIHYPTADVKEIGDISAVIREQVLATFKGNMMSYSFSFNKSSGYIMVYPTAPILSIRISTHESDGSIPVENLISESEDKRTVVINAEALGGQRIAEAIISEAITEAYVRRKTIKNIINGFDI